MFPSQEAKVTSGHGSPCKIRFSGLGRLPDGDEVLTLHLVAERGKGSRLGCSSLGERFEVEKGDARMAATAMAKRGTEFGVFAMLSMGKRLDGLRFSGMATMSMGMVRLIEAGQQRQDQYPNRHECMQCPHVAKLSGVGKKCNAEIGGCDFGCRGDSTHPEAPQSTATSVDSIHLG